MAKPMDQYKWHELTVVVLLKMSETQWSIRPGLAFFQARLEQGKMHECGLCWLFCPDAAIRQRDDGFYEADLDYCKGCGICAKECKPGAIAMVEEER